MSDQYSEYKLFIEALSSTHIGNGQVLSSLGEYFLTSDNVLFPDHKKLHCEILKEGHQEAYIESILNSDGKVNIYQWLTQLDIPIEIERRIQLNQNKQITDQKNNLYEHIKSGKKCNSVYIPGSSVKGMIKTALINHYIGNDAAFKRKFNNEIVNHLNKENPRQSYLTYCDRIENEIYSEQMGRALRCEDSSDIEDAGIVVEQVNRTGSIDTSTDSLDWLVECIAKGSVAEAKLSISKYEMSIVKHGILLSSFKEIMDALNSFAKANLLYEKVAIQKLDFNGVVKQALQKQIDELLNLIENSNGDFAIARLGKGKTQMFQTLWLSIDEPHRTRVMQLFKKKDQEIHPQTRVLTVNGREMMGWVKIKFQEIKPPKNTYDNRVETLKEGDILKATVLKKKKVEIMINGEIYEVNMINKFYNFETHEEIDVIVHQLKKDGTLSQVKPNR